ncbi:MAG: hypothetical protein RL596_939 [Bacteroidota bacterium]
MPLKIVPLGCMPLKTFKYSKDNVTIVWKPEQCIHSKICWTDLRDVFDPFRKPWVNMDGASLEAIVAQVGKCPSGALSILSSVENKHMDNQSSKEPVAIQIKLNGPILIQTSCAVTKPDGTVEIREGVTALCRCGASANKPYCDGAHKKIEFKD